MAHQNLNRSGFESRRNKAKPYRPIRLVKNAKGEYVQHDLDTMRMSESREHYNVKVNTTGCFGVRNYDSVGFDEGIRKIEQDLHRGLPGRRTSRKKKRGCRLYAGNPARDFRDDSLKELYNIRGELLTVMYFGRTLSQKLMDIVRDITAYLTNNYNRKQIIAMFKQDKLKCQSIKGMARSGVRPKKIKHLDSKIRRAIHLLQGGTRK